ncbi:MAG: hypothetical protein EOO14_04710 [Chitinophagaceae bacterium]|nr:MAG: hypothetical protein EOO14_04710 [Chitinophagaceae bacterium]
MQPSLSNFKTTFSPAFLRKAASCAVRECDETSKGTFEAYVDQGEESYDVMLGLGKGKEVVSHRCDCGSTEAFCRHKAALLLHLAGTISKKEPSVKGKKAKQSKVGILLEEVDAESLKTWVRELLEENKDLALAFEKRFEEKKTIYTKAEAEALTTEAIKSVVKNRMRIEISELKKIVALWTSVHQPVVNAYMADVASDAGFWAFHAVLESCLLFDSRVHTNSVKVPNYVQSLLDKSVEPIAQLYTDEAFNTATGYFENLVLAGANGVRIHYLAHLQKVLTVSSAERLEAGTKKLVQQYNKALSERRHNGNEYTKLLFSFVEANGFLPRYLTTFQPIRYDNAFNALLLENLLAAGALDLAESYAKAQIESNIREEYDIPYLKVLQEIYRRKKNDDALADIIEKLLPYTFDFDDYLFLDERKPDTEEKKKWRTKLLSRAKSAASYGRSDSESFYFRVLSHEKRYKKMVDAIRAETPLKVIVEYFEPMAAADKQGLLRVIINMHENFGWSYGLEQKNDNESYFPQLAALMKKTYGEQMLKLAIIQAGKNRFYVRESKFISYLNETVGAG